MTDLALPNDETYTGGSPLLAWADGARAAHAIAVSLAKTPFVPRDMQNKPELVTACILAGYEMGLQPMAALRSIDIIQGTPAMRAHAIRGLVQSRGHEVWVEETTTIRAVVCGQRKGSDKVEKSVWTMDRARLLKLADKPNYQTQPDAMLVARATAEVCRRIAADVLLGLPYAVEELDDQQPSAPRRTAKRKPAEPAPPMDEPAMDAAPEVSPDQVAIEGTPEPDLDE